MPGYLKDVANQPNRQTFPGAKFEITGQVPLPQCSEADIQGTNGDTHNGDIVLRDNGAFTDRILFDTILNITSPPGNVGTYDIILNNEDLVQLVQQTPVTSVENHYYISNPNTAKLEGVNGQTWADDNSLKEILAFGAFDLTGKILHITAPPANVGQYDIVANNEDVLNLLQRTPIASLVNQWFIPTAPEITITRNLQSFAQYLSTLGLPYTIKAGKIYTSASTSQLEPSCKILFDPLT